MSLRLCPRSGSGSTTKRCQEYGRKVDELPIRRDIYVAPDLATAKKHVDPVIQSGDRGFTGEKLEALFVGGPDEIIAEIEKYRRLGCNHFLFRHIVRDQSQMLSSIRLLGRESHPLFPVRTFSRTKTW